MSCFFQEEGRHFAESLFVERHRSVLTTGHDVQCLQSANEALELNTEPGDERAAVSSELMPQMLVASFVCVTIVSVIIAGVLVNYLV